MQDGVTAGDGAIDCWPIPYVACEELDLRDRLCGQHVEPAARATRVVANERADLCAFLYERFHHVTSDESARAGDQDSSSRQARSRAWHASHHRFQFRS